MLFAEVNGETVAFGRVWWTQEDATCRLYKSLGTDPLYPEVLIMKKDGH